MFRKIAWLAITIILICAIAAYIASTKPSGPAASPPYGGKVGYDVRLVFPADRYPETASHIRDAIAQGESAVCTIDRRNADAHRKASLESIPTRKGYDRDEWPMAMCAEGGEGADIRYVTPSDNRGAGSWIGNELDQYADGTRVLIVVEESAGYSEDIHTSSSTDANARNSGSKAADGTGGTPTGSNSDLPDVYYRSCTDARQAGAAPLHTGDPGYSLKLDRDGDGTACE